MPETPKVAAFIAQRQHVVLVRGVEALTATDRTDLKEQVHRLVGTFGSYQIDDAVAALLPLHELLNSERPAEDCVEHERLLALDSLAVALKAREAQA